MSMPDRPVAAMMAAVKDFATTRAEARAALRGNPLYPRLTVNDAGWLLQRAPGAVLEPITDAEARLLCGVAA